MARQLRIDYPGAWHHIMNRGRRRETIFPNVEDRHDFMRLLGIASERYGLEVNAYALMGNHYHLLVHTPVGGLSAAMKHIDGVFAQSFNRRYGLDGPVFRDRFRSKLVDSRSYLGSVARYIHRNPIDLVGPENLAEYEWSSYSDFLKPPIVRPPWLLSDALRISGVKIPAGLRKATLGRSADGFDPGEFPQVIGDSDFVNAVLARSKIDPQTIGHLRAGVVRPTPAQIRRAVEGVFVGAQDRRLVDLGLCQELGGLPLDRIAERFGYASAQSAGSAAHRFRRRLENETWGLLVEQVRKRLEGTMVDERCR